jgi:hypothetical protein
MPFDPARITASLTELAAAERVYADALRSRAAPEVIASARSRVTAARGNLDRTRLGELAGLAALDRLAGTVAGDQAIALFPVSIEAKLEPAQRRLRLRFWPDTLATASHDPRLSDAEVDYGKRYWSAEAVAVSDQEHRDAWREFAERLGPTRAAFVADALTPTNRGLLSPTVAPQFPSVALADPQAPFVPRAVLPDLFVAVGFVGQSEKFRIAGKPIPRDLATGLDTTPSESEGLNNAEGKPIRLPPRMRWLTDFGEAVKVGMALEIPIDPAIDHLDLLVAFGVRVTETPAQGAETLETLLLGHRFSRGIAFVPEDTPTNNTEAGGSGMPTSSERVDAAWDLERRPRAYPEGLGANGKVTGAALGIDAALLAAAPASGAVPSLKAEPGGFSDEIARAMQTVLWQASLGPTVEDVLGVEGPRVEAIRTHARERVRAAGPLPTLRIGRQPYGILPVTQVDAFHIEPGEGIDEELFRLAWSVRNWWRDVADKNALFAGTLEDALRDLARSKAVRVETTRVGATRTDDNSWGFSARALKFASVNTIPDNWRSETMKTLRDGTIGHIDRAPVDNATPEALRGIAAAAPDTLSSLPRPSSLFSRMAHHAALLEWGRWARAVCEAALDAPSLVKVRADAQAKGIGVWTAIVVDALRGGRHRPDMIGIADRLDRLDGIDRIDPRLPPDRPRAPLPHPPPSLVDAAEKTKIAQLVGSLEQPLATSPGAQRLGQFRQALQLLAEVPMAALTSAFFGTLDLCNHRVDAWITSLATCRLATLRARAPRGLAIGAFGWLLDVRPADPAGQRAEYVHTPSLDQAAAAAVLRGAALRSQQAGSSHADVDLSSRRVRMARWILEGVRNGRSLGELLGARFERTLKKSAGAGALRAARSRWAAKPGGMVDGLKLLADTTGADAATSTAIDHVNETIDALSDVLTAESVYQLVRGSPAGALLDLEAIAQGAAPPRLEMTETPSTGLRLTHRLVVAVPSGARAAGWQAPSSPRAQAEPLLEAWCGALLGPAARIHLTVEDGTRSLPVPLERLGIGALDVVLAGRDGGAELAERLLAAARGLDAGLGEARVRTDRAWKDLVGVATTAARVMARAEALTPGALSRPGVEAPDESEGDLLARVAQARLRLEQIRAALPTRAREAADFGVRVPGLLLAATPSDAELVAVSAAIDLRLGHAAAAAGPRDQLRALFGGELRGLTSFTPPDAEVLTTAVSTPSELLTDPPSSWLDSIGRVRAGAARLADLIQRGEITGHAPSSALLVAQSPWQAGDRWIATQLSSRDGKPPAGTLSILLHAPFGVAAGQPLGGLLVDAWNELVPSEKVSTAMALRFNAPNTRPPQAILMAVNPDLRRPWSEDTLIAILMEALELSRLRMQRQTTLSQAGLRPLIMLGQTGDGAGISFAME